MRILNPELSNINHTWSFNNDLENPTIQPSIMVKRSARLKDICHSYITNGKIKFLPDCTHSLKDQTVNLPDWGRENENNKKVA